MTVLTDDEYEKLPDLQVRFKMNDEESVRINFPKDSYMYDLGGGQYLFAARGVDFTPIDMR